MSTVLARWSLDEGDGETLALPGGTSRPLRVVWFSGYAELVEVVDDTGRVRAAFKVNNSSAVFAASGVRVRTKGARGAAGTVEAA
jgi:hypothetical protein